VDDEDKLEERFVPLGAKIRGFIGNLAHKKHPPGVGECLHFVGEVP
jgi:hypothetical protein